MYQSNETVSYCALCDRKIYSDDFRAEFRGEFKWVENLGYICGQICQGLYTPKSESKKTESKTDLEKLDEALALTFARHTHGEISSEELGMQVNNILYQIEIDYFERKKAKILVESRKVKPTETVDTVATFWKAS